MDEEIFPEEADGVITFLNTERLSRRKDTLGDIFHGLLIPENEELKNKDMGKRRKEVFTEEEVRKTCNKEQKLIDKFTEENRVSDIKFMFSEGISPERIAEGTKLTLEKVKKILKTNSIYGGPGICPHSLLTYLADPDSQLHLQDG